MTHKKHTGIMALVCVLAGVGIAFAAYWVARGGRSETPLTTERYRNESESLEGNRYVVRGQIETRFGSTAGYGSVLFVKVFEGGGRLPVLVPQESKTNFEPGQSYRFYVKVTRGKLALTDAEKE
jgi:hypothetical protein